MCNINPFEELFQRRGMGNVLPDVNEIQEQEPDEVLSEHNLDE